MGSVELARVAAPSLGASNTIPNSIQQIALRVPCYCGYRLQEGDSDKLGKWAGVVKGGAGDWVRQLQTDLIEFGVQKNGLIIEKKIPQPDKTVKNKKPENQKRSSSLIKLSGRELPLQQAAFLTRRQVRRSSFFSGTQKKLRFDNWVITKYQLELLTREMSTG